MRDSRWHNREALRGINDKGVSSEMSAQGWPLLAKDRATTDADTGPKVQLGPLQHPKQHQNYIIQQMGLSVLL